MRDLEASESMGYPVDLVLRVTLGWAHGDRHLEYRLLSPSGTVSGLPGRPLRSEPLGDADAFEKELSHEIYELRGGLDIDGNKMIGGEIEQVLESLGTWLYHRLFPPPMRRLYGQFRDQVETLLVMSDESWIPWEIVRPDEHPDDDFLCLRFDMGRWSVATEPVVEKVVERPLYVAGAEVSEAREVPDLDGEEIRTLEAMLSGAPKVDLEKLVAPTFDTLIEALGRGADLVHFAGHGEHPADGDASRQPSARPEMAKILLADRPFRARDSSLVASRLREDRPVVFFNSCESGRLGRALTGLGGWSQSWIDDCRASAFLAPALPVSQSTARSFAASVYRELAAGQTVGRAVRRARLDLPAHRPTQKVARLLYSLHAHPNLRVRPGPSKTVLDDSRFGRSPLRWPTPRSDFENAPPGALLRAENHVVPFHFREQEVADLESWCESGEPIGVRLYTGFGGMGKTRLALELCGRFQRKGWQVGFLDEKKQAEETWDELEALDQPRLVLIDYAETLRPLLVSFSRLLVENESTTRPTRILLLARAALDWWEHLKSEGDGVGELFSGPRTEHLILRPLAFEPEARERSYFEAIRAFAKRLGKPEPESAPEDLEADYYDRVLLLHMSALAAIDGVEVKGKKGILDYVLDRERRFWRKTATTWSLSPEMERGLGRAMAVITLSGGVDDEDHAVRVMRRLRYFQDEKESLLIHVAHLLRSIYPGESHWIEPVLPDLLGGHLVKREMKDDSPELLALVLGQKSRKQLEHRLRDRE